MYLHLPNWIWGNNTFLFATWRILKNFMSELIVSSFPTWTVLCMLFARRQNIGFVYLYRKSKPTNIVYHRPLQKNYFNFSFLCSLECVKGFFSAKFIKKLPSTLKCLCTSSLYVCIGSWVIATQHCSFGNMYIENNLVIIHYKSILVKPLIKIIDIDTISHVCEDVWNKSEL